LTSSSVSSAQSAVEFFIASFPTEKNPELRLPKISAAYPVFDEGAVRDPAQIIDLVRRIRTLIKPAQVGPAAERKPSWRSWPVSHRLVFVDGRTNESARACADQGAHGGPARVPGSCGAKDRARGGAPAGALPRRRVAGRKSECGQEQH